MSGVEGEQVVLILEDHQFVEPSFLELINSLLSAGEVPGLYTPEELEPMLSPLRDQASDEGWRGTLAQYFAKSKSKLRTSHKGSIHELNLPVKNRMYNQGFQNDFE